MNLESNNMSTYCSRLTFLLEDFLRSTNETRCFLTETCQDLIQLNKCLYSSKSYYTCDVHERASDTVHKANVVEKYEIQEEKKSRSNLTCNINNEHTNPKSKIIKLPKKKSSCLRTNYPNKHVQNKNMISGITRQKKIGLIPAKVINVSEHDSSCVTDLEINLKSMDANISQNNVIDCSDRCFPLNCKIFSKLEGMKYSAFPLHMLNLFKNNNSYLTNTLKTTVNSNFVKTNIMVESDSNVVENSPSEKSFLNILSFVNTSRLNEESDPVVKVLCETQSIYLAVMEIIKNKALKLDHLLMERIMCLERRFLHLLNFCESASTNVKEDKKQKAGTCNDKIVWKSVEFWNQSCATEVQALIYKPYIQYKSSSEWEKYQKTLQLIQQKKMQLLILETLISDFLPQLHNLDPNSPNTHLLLTIAFTLTGTDKYSIPLLIKV